MTLSNRQIQQMEFLKKRFAWDEKACLTALTKIVSFHIEVRLNPEQWGYTNEFGIKPKDRHLFASLISYLAEHGHLTSKQMGLLKKKLPEYAERYLVLVDQQWLYDEIDYWEPEDLEEILQ